MSRRLALFAAAFPFCISLGLAGVSAGRDCDALRKRASDAPLALSGLDPVLLVEGKAQPGESRFSTVHGPFRYQFASLDSQRTFEARPDKYGVQLHRFCPTQADRPGKSDVLVVYEKRIYLFVSDGCDPGSVEAPRPLLPL